jgi:hypothetical protein
VKMTQSERLLGVMLAELMETIGTKGEIDPTFVKRMLINHDDWALEYRYHGFLNREEPPAAAVVEETGSIMMMMSHIERSVEELKAQGGADLSESYALKFRGFDGNNDDHHGVAHTLVHELDRFGEFHDRALNSHSMATLQTYRRIMPVYNGIMAGNWSPYLTEAQLLEIAAAADA